ncbi:MAG: glycosyltransferase [Ilumatobacteraceae bacterium]
MSGSRQPRVSVIVPAHDEQHHLSACLESICAAAASIRCDIEIVVVVSSRTGNITAQMALDAGAHVLVSSGQTVGAALNAGVAASAGSIVVTMDADGLMAHDALREIEHHLATGVCIGGAATVVPERRSVGIALTMAVVKLTEKVSGLGSGMYWCRREDFDAIEGYNPTLTRSVGADFARRLREHGRSRGRRFVNLRATPVVASCSAFDRNGDWHMIGRFRLPDAAPSELKRRAVDTDRGSSLTVL